MIAVDSAGVPQPVFAHALNERLGYSAATAGSVAAWYQGDAQPPAHVWAAALVIGGTDLLPLVESVTAGQTRGRLEDDVERRHFLGAMTGLAATAGFAGGNLEPWERLAYALRHPKRIDNETVAQLTDVTMTLEQLEARVNPQVLVESVTGHLNTLVSFLQSSPPPGIDRRLLTLAGETAGVASWLLWDVGAPQSASSYANVGLEAAGDAADTALGAYLVGTASVVENRREHPEGRVDRLKNPASGFSRANATPSTRAYLAMLEAKARSRARDETNCLRAIEEAMLAIEPENAKDADLLRPRIPFYDAARLAGEHGLCLVRLGHLTEARTIIKSALDSLPASQVKTRPALVTALANSHVPEDIDEACRLAETALDMGVGMQVEPNRQDVLELREKLEPWRETAAVKRLDERLRSNASSVA